MLLADQKEKWWVMVMDVGLDSELSKMVWGEEEADPVLETAMEYASALGTIIFDRSCCLWDLTEAQVGRNQFAMDVVVDWLDGWIDKVDGRVDHTSEHLLMLEGKVTDMEAGSLNSWHWVGSKLRHLLNPIKHSLIWPLWLSLNRGRFVSWRRGWTSCGRCSLCWNTRRRTQ